jgi:SAM-dependent methyltransferase
MSIKTISHNANDYPSFQAEGFAAQFAFPFAFQVCKGVGFDIGCNRLTWSLHPDEGRAVVVIDPALKYDNGYCTDKEVAKRSGIITGGPYHAMQLPDLEPDFIFSSHCLEHIPDWVTTLGYWHSKLRPGGVLFLYLPDFSQSYWRPWANRKHIHCFTPKVFKKYIADQPAMWTKGFVSGVDLNNSFIVIAEKA